jgi:Uma2 family endonuclease
MGQGLDEHHLTVEAWANLPDEAGELRRGRLVPPEQVSFLHGFVLVWLAHELHGWALPHGATVVGEKLRLALGPDIGRKPDLAIYLPGDQRPPLDATLVTVLPSVVVEIVSKDPADAHRDRIDKMKDYEAAGIRWYWLLDLHLRLLEIHRLGYDQRYARAFAAGEGSLGEVPGCPGLLIDLTALWNQIEALRRPPPTPRRRRGKVT